MFRDPSVVLSLVAVLMAIGLFLWIAWNIEEIHKIPELVSDVELLKATAYRDPLTGLFTGWHLQEVALPTALRTQDRTSVIVADLDAFKKTNDTEGHAAGDRLLVRAAGAIRQAVPRRTDAVGRWYRHGDEFGIVLPGADSERAAEVAIRVFNALQEANIPASMSVLCTERLDGRPTVARLIDQADELLRQAKKLGRGMVVGMREDGLSYRLHPSPLPAIPGEEGPVHAS
jgi:diguanylate cyclase (GGDEF)-like protein